MDVCCSIGHFWQHLITMEMYLCLSHSGWSSSPTRVGICTFITTIGLIIVLELSLGNRIFDSMEYSLRTLKCTATRVSTESSVIIIRMLFPVVLWELVPRNSEIQQFARMLQKFNLDRNSNNAHAHYNHFKIAVPHA